MTTSTHLAINLKINYEKKNSHARKLCPLHQIEQQIRFNEQNALVTFIFVPLVLLNNSQAYRVNEDQSRIISVHNTGPWMT